MKEKQKALLFLVALLAGVSLLRSSACPDEFLEVRFLGGNILLLLSILFLPFPKNFRWHWMDALFLGSYLWTLLSAAWSYLPVLAVYPAQKIFLAWMAFLCFRMVIKKEYLKYIQYILMGMLVITSGIVFVQIANLSGSGGDIFSEDVYKIYGFSAHKNLVSSFLFMICGLLFYLFYKEKNNKWYYLIFLLPVIPVLILRSRSVWLAFLVLGLSSLFLLKPPYKKWGLGLAGILLGGFLALMILPGNYLGKYHPSQVMNEGTGAERRFIWYKTRELIKDRPLLGYGGGNWKLFVSSKSVEGAYRMQSQDVTFTRVHNDFLEAFAEQGVVGFLLYIFIFGLAFWILFLQIRNNDIQKKNEALLLLGVLAGYVVIANFDFPRERIEHQVYMSLILALSVFFYGDKFYFKNLNSKNSLKIVRYILAAILLFGIYFSYNWYEAAKEQKKIILATNNQNWNQMIEAGKRGDGFWTPIDAASNAFSFHAGMGYYYQEKFAKALPLLKRAAELNPHHFQTQNNYANALTMLKRYKEAIPVYQLVLTINPNFQEGFLNICYAYIQLGDLKNAKFWLDKVTMDLPRKKQFAKEIERLSRQ